MARLRQMQYPPQHASSPPPPSSSTSSPRRLLRIFATGTVFLTHTLLLPSCPLPGSASRAQAVQTTRGGTVGHVLALLAQLAATAPALGDVEAMLVASLGGTPEAVRLRDALEGSGVRTKYCKVWSGLGVPCAWVMHARDSGERTVINHNPLPDVSHEDFIVLLGPVLAPENYVGYHQAPQQQQLQLPIGPAREQQSSSPVPLFPNTLAPAPPRSSLSSRPQTAGSTMSSPSAHMVPSASAHSPAPFDWLHFDGRSTRATLANLRGVDGLARERRWRSHYVVSVDLGRRAREGVEMLLPLADVVFLCATTFPALSLPTAQAGAGAAATPRAMLLSLARHAAAHALLVLNAGREGAALLSMPTREYLQSSGWSPPPPPPPSPRTGRSPARVHGYSDSTATTTANDGVESVRTASDFWAGVRTGDTSRDSAYTDPGRSHRHHPSGESFHPFDEMDEGGAGEDGRHTPQPRRQEPVVPEETTDEEGAHAAFVTGMIWALSRRLLPGPPYTPEAKDPAAADVGVRWRLDECLRFATELAGRRAHVQPCAGSGSSSRERSEWDGLGEEMRRAGWFD